MRKAIDLKAGDRRLIQLSEAGEVEAGHCSSDPIVTD
jgi:hypothetical protein